MPSEENLNDTKAETRTRVELDWRMLSAIASHAIVLGVLIGLLAYPRSWQRWLEPITPIQHGTASIGGPFELVDQLGRTVSAATFLGRPLLVTFGYIGDTEFTPATLQKLAEVRRRLASEADRVATLFISLDAANDTPAKMLKFIEQYDRAIVAASGSEAQIVAVANAFRLPIERSVATTAGSSGTIHYEPLIFLMNSDGHYVTHLSHETGVDALMLMLRSRP